MLGVCALFLWKTTLLSWMGMQVSKFSCKIGGRKAFYANSDNYDYRFLTCHLPWDLRAGYSNLKTVCKLHNRCLTHLWERIPRFRGATGNAGNGRTQMVVLSSFIPSFVHIKKCPLCEVMFPPNYDQSKFEEHVESHWKVCPMCSEQFPPDYDQQSFERHVQTHFDQNVLNFD